MGGGLRLFSEKEMTGHKLFQEMKMTGLLLFLEKKMMGPRLFLGLRISHFPLCRTINFAPSLKTLRRRYLSGGLSIPQNYPLFPALKRNPTGKNNSLYITFFAGSFFSVFLFIM